MSINGPRIGHRRTVPVIDDGSTHISALYGTPTLPVVVEAPLRRIRLKEWLSDNVAQVNDCLHRSGGVLFRRFEVGGMDGFAEAMKVLCGGRLSRYVHGSTPRSRLYGSVYTATEYPAHMTIPLHNEMSYTDKWPMRLGFYCIEPARSGGETLVADSRKVLARIDPDARQRFADCGVVYCRRYRRDVDVSWQRAFETSEKSDVEHYCLENGIGFWWLNDGGLRTQHISQGVARHPITGDDVWFNQAHLFHRSALPPDVQKTLVETLGTEGMPRDARHGDNTEIEPESLVDIRAAFDREATEVRWERNDVLILDNMLAAHGRNAFKGSRQVVVAMGLPYEST